ncbi:LIM domain-containing protein PLIM2c [Hibiscus syriacus]|uniref:LIM domain-containing protein PLIM2c n=1 Tax=Hibiscus syriacus TaxID=106335 RepID=A0A6A2YKW8_HIBSY|nr:LIM domain-containing protein PLIM2c [Hibiscus syriacus]
MAFTGTLDKCKACDKTVYVVDMMTLEGIPYHKTCFKCTHCRGNLVMSNYSSMDGVLYCKTHFEQLFKESGNYSKNFQPSKEKNSEYTKAPNKHSSFFSGTQDKCAACHKTVYPLEKVRPRRVRFDTLIICSTGWGPVLQAPFCSAFHGQRETTPMFSKLLPTRETIALRLRMLENQDDS